MFDFSKLGKSSSREIPSTNEELFNQLDRRATHTSLRPVQVAALSALDKQQQETDIVLKLSTGSGKTVVGLVYAEMMRRRFRGEPVLYLCPTTQLVEQAAQTAQAIGVAASTFGVHGYPYEAMAGDSVLLCTYDRLFNSKSTFENKGIRPSAIVLDDVHAGIERVRGCYTALAPAQCYDRIRGVLRPLCENSDAETWRGIDNGASDAVYEVPYWVWAAVSQQIGAVLESAKGEDSLLFRWENISRYIELARVCISGTAVEIALPLAAVEENSAYMAARHRLFMSASIKDGSSLIADLACDPAALGRLIEPAEDAGVGERMILPTSLIAAGVKKDEIALVCRTLSAKTNVVVLTSSLAQAKVWERAGANVAQGKHVDAAIEALRTSVRQYVAFAQRFDGVDLPDDACRVLVIDGIPTGERLCDQIDSDRQKGSPEYEVRTVNRFEQALGRAVRSSADYAVVLLVGTDVAAFIGKKSVQMLMEGRTLAQLDLGRELAKMAPGKAIADVIEGMTDALLSRDESWKETHRVRVRGAPVSVRRAGGFTPYERVAIATREAWKLAKARNFQAAVQTLRTASNDAALHPIQKAEIIYKVAAGLHHFDPGAAAEAYRSAFQLNARFPRPEKAADRRFAKVGDQALAIRAFFGDFAAANAAIAALDEIKMKLSFALPAETVEQGLMELGLALGAASSRPEKETGRGPDALWLFDDLGFCLEAKSEKTSKIFKKDAAQLALSVEWCATHVDMPPDAIVPTFVTDVIECDREEDVEFGPRVIDEKAAMNLIERLKQFVLGSTFEGPLFADPAAVSKRLQELNLSGKQIKNSIPKLG